MNVKRIVVDRLPHSCSNCHYVRYHQYNISGEVFQYACGANRISKQIEGEVELYRPEWCPLEVEEVCEWKEHWEYTSKIDNEGFWHIDTKCDWIYPEDYDVNIAELELDTIGDFVKLMGFTHCPNCGKRIVYKESE